MQAIRFMRISARRTSFHRVPLHVLLPRRCSTIAAARRPCAVVDLRCAHVPYMQALSWQRALAKQRYNRPELPDALLMLEHPPVYTLGPSHTQNDQSIAKPKENQTKTKQKTAPPR